jgi:hypothetical protein
MAARAPAARIPMASGMRVAQGQACGPTRVVRTACGRIPWAGSCGKAATAGLRTTADVVPLPGRGTSGRMAVVMARQQRGRRRRQRALAQLGLLAALAGCAPPTVDVVVAWVERRRDRDGNRQMRIYDRGEALSITIAPTVPHSDADRLAIEVDNRGTSIAVSGPRHSMSVQALDDGRRHRLDPGHAGGGNLAAEFFGARNGDAFVRGFEREAAPALALLPTSSPQAGTVAVLHAPIERDVGSWAWLGASDAPILVGFDVPIEPEAELEVLAYPSDHGVGIGPIAQVESVARGRIVGRTGTRAAQRLWCPHGLCVAPEGSSVTVLGGPCTVQWWSWMDGIDGIDGTDGIDGIDMADDAMDEADPQPTSVVLQEGCPALGDPELIAQLEHDVVLLEDADRLYVADLTTGAVRPGPQLWRQGIGLPPAARMQPAQRGRAMVFVSQEGRIVHADASGVRVLNAEATSCVVPLAVVTSPSGAWTVATCNGDGSFLPRQVGVVYRMSTLGFEAYPGIPMLPLAVDDEGAALLYSFDPDDVRPRSLFVLTVDGRLDRVDRLDAEPARARDGRQTPTRFWVAQLVP